MISTAVNRNMGYVVYIQDSGIRRYTPARRNEKAIGRLLSLLKTKEDEVISKILMMKNSKECAGAVYKIVETSLATNKIPESFNSTDIIFRSIEDYSSIIDDIVLWFRYCLAVWRAGGCVEEPAITFKAKLSSLGMEHI